jgi:hypothetical protein
MKLHVADHLARDHEQHPVGVTEGACPVCTTITGFEGSACRISSFM